MLFNLSFQYNIICFVVIHMLLQMNYTNILFTFIFFALVNEKNCLLRFINRYLFFGYFNTSTKFKLFGNLRYYIDN